MSTQLLLTDAYARNTDPDTAEDAAESVRYTELEHIVFVDLISHGPGTSEEISDRLNIPLQSITPRLRPLTNKGFVEVIGKKPNRSHRMALIWQAKRDKENLEMQINFNAWDYDPTQGAGVCFPLADYRVEITAAEAKPTLSNINSGLLELSLTILEGQFQGMVQKHRLNLFNQSEAAKQIAQKELAAICFAINRPHIQEETQLIGGRFLATIGPQDDNPKYSEVKLVKCPDGSLPIRPAHTQNAATLPVSNAPTAPAWGGPPNASPAPAAPPVASPVSPQAPSWAAQTGAVPASSSTPPWAR